MFNAFKEGPGEVLGGDSKALTPKTELFIAPVGEERLWIDVVKRMVVCMRSNGFYYEIEETPPPFVDVNFGVFCEVAVADETGTSYKAALQSFHYPGDKGESQILQISQEGDNSHTFVTVSFRSNVNAIRLTPDSAVRKSRRISSYPRKLDPSGELQLLGKLGRVIVDERMTLALFEKRQKDGRSVAWINMPLLPGGLE